MSDDKLAIMVISDVRLVREAIAEYLNHRGVGPVLSIPTTALATDSWRRNQRDVSFAIVDIHQMESAQHRRDFTEIIRLVRERCPRALIVALGGRLELAAQAVGADLRLPVASASVRELARLARELRDGTAPALDGDGDGDGAKHDSDCARWRTLSRREQQVLGLLAAGQENSRIASTLGITQRTVKAHVSSLLKKLSAESRTELAIVAREAGFNGSCLPQERRPRS